jgi:predicted RNA-binding Zn-ribbon protein involved in translation (DUF1610 family)
MRPIVNQTSHLRCADCGRDDDATRGWRIYLVAAPQAPATHTVCPDCAERELGEDER